MKKNKIIILFLSVSTIFLLGGTGGNALVEHTSTPEFCGSCHTMEGQFASWSKRGPHTTLSCVECHLPNSSLAEHLLWKGIDGGKDFLFFHTGFAPDVIRISDHGRKTVKENCIRCHKDLLVHTGSEPDCVRCHRQMHHTQAPALIQ